VDLASGEMGEAFSMLGVIMFVGPSLKSSRLQSDWPCEIWREGLLDLDPIAKLPVVNQLSFVIQRCLLTMALGIVGCHTPGSEQARDSLSQPEEHVRVMGQEVSDHQLTYLLQTPGGEKPDAGWPLLLFLHGYGECGDEIVKVRKHGPPKLISQFAPLQGCTVISPQCPSDSWWRVDALHALVEEVIADRGDVDRDRLYVTGLSMGGYGIWSFLSHYPEYFAAAIPICGGGDPFRLPANRPPVKQGIVNEFLPEGLKKAMEIPVWTFHGTDDGSVPIVETEMMIDLLKQGGNSNAKLTAFPGEGHVGAWERAYDDPQVWGWLFSQSRGL
jgi:predicted peptidase